MNIMNRFPTALICAIPILTIAVVTLVFMVKAYRESQRIGMSKSYIKKVIINSILVSIIPTLPIIISMGIMMPILGKYVPWLRLSVIGAANYELMAADTAMKATGFAEGLTNAAIPDSSFITIVWAMSLGCITSLIITAICLKKYDQVLAGAKGKISLIGAAGGCAMTVVLCVFTVPKLVAFHNPDILIAVISSAIFAVIFTKLAKLTKIKVLNDFCFPLSMTAAMAVLVLIHL